MEAKDIIAALYDQLGGHRQILHTPPFLISPTLLPLQVEAKEGDLIAALDDQLGDIVKFFMAKEAEMLGKLEQLELEVCVCGGGKLGWEGLEVRVCVWGGGRKDGVRGTWNQDHWIFTSTSQGSADALPFRCSPPPPPTLRPTAWSNSG